MMGDKANFSNNLSPEVFKESDEDYQVDQTYHEEDDIDWIEYQENMKINHIWEEVSKKVDTQYQWDVLSQDDLVEQNLVIGLANNAFLNKHLDVESRER